MFGRTKQIPVQNDPQSAPPGDIYGRILTLKIILLLFFLIVALRLVQIQVVQASGYQDVARRQHEATVPLPATRGFIYDRNGRLLVSNTELVTFGADPKLVDDQAGNVAGLFARTFGKPRDWYLAKLTTPNRRFVYLERRVDPQYSKRIPTGDLEGVIVMNEPQRLYHYDHVGGQLIGFTNIDNDGLSGIELQFDRQLKGASGYVVLQRDALGRRRPSVDYPRAEPLNGYDVVLTIDIEYQAIAEEELKKGIERNGAESGLAIMMDPATGEILALANYPSINANELSHADAAAMKNRAITDMFEPGSVFKVVTASAALEYHLVSPEQKFFAERGSYWISLPSGKPRQITDMHEYGLLTFRQAMELSSNIVMAKVSDLIGAERMYTMARNFGFGTSTGIELPGEVGGELKKPTQWSGTTLNTIAFGYEVGVTPIQVVAAYAAVANQGRLMKPFVVKQILDERHQVIVETKPQIVRRVISKETAQTLTSFLEGVVDRGTGMSAKLGSLRVAGKTGTSRKYVGEAYETGSYTASFVGFFPAEDPKVACLVMLDNPRSGGYTGGLASAPIFKGIAEKVYATTGRFSRRPADHVAEGQQLSVPDVTSLKADVARSILSSQGFDVAVQGEGRVVRRQVPDPGTVLSPGEVVRLLTDDVTAAIPPGLTVVPDLRQLPIRRAVNRLSMQHLDVLVRGSGVVIAQDPAAGQRVKIGTHVTVQCEPKNLSMITMY